MKNLSSFHIRNSFQHSTGGHPQEATLHGVQIERLFPQRRNSLSHFYGEEDREITSVRLVMERSELLLRLASFSSLVICMISGLWCCFKVNAPFFLSFFPVLHLPC